MSTPKPDETPEIPEADKPFYLGIVSAIMLVIDMLLGGIGAYNNNLVMIDYAKYFFAPLFGLVSAAWAWYFGKKT
jgi:hypothetical protein